MITPKDKHINHLEDLISYTWATTEMSYRDSNYLRSLAKEMIVILKKSIDEYDTKRS